MGRWAQRRRAGTSKPAAIAQILSVKVDLADNTRVVVTFNADLSAVDAGVGELDNNTTADAGILDVRVNPNQARYEGFADPNTPGDAWVMADATGLHFVGGLTLQPPFSGIMI